MTEAGKPEVEIEKDVFEFRHVTNPSELDALAPLNTSFGDLKFEFTPEYIARLKEYLKDKNACQLMAMDDDEIAGYAAASENLFPEHLWLIELFIDPKYQGKGIAMNLIDRMAAFAQSQGLKGMMTETESENVPARKLYEICGFVAVPNSNWEGVTYRLDLANTLTPGQRRFLASLSEEKLNRIIHIEPWSSDAYISAEKIIEDIRHAAPNCEVELGGSLAYKIAGEEDIDINIFYTTPEQRSCLDNLKKLFGEGEQKGEYMHAWGFERDGIHVGIWFVDPERSPAANETRQLQKLFKEKPELIEEYERVKLSMDGKTYKEYQIAKYEFYNNILRSVG